MRWPFLEHSSEAKRCVKKITLADDFFCDSEVLVDLTLITKTVTARFMNRLTVERLYLKANGNHVPLKAEEIAGHLKQQIQGQQDDQKQS